MRFPNQVIGVDAAKMPALARMACLKVFRGWLAMRKTTHDPMRNRLDIVIPDGTIAVVVFSKRPNQAVIALITNVLFDERKRLAFLGGLAGQEFTTAVLHR
jgi:hypothetical protein